MTELEPTPLISYAQNREDLYLWALLAHRTPGTYVDVGCNHERLHSVTRLFYEHGWRGINIDANPKMEAEFSVRPRDQFVLAGVGESEAELIFRDYPLHDGLSTFDDAIKAIHEASGYPHVDRSVRVRTLSSILEELDVTSVDFLKIDVEGLEASVLRGLDLSVVRPAVIVAEATRADDCDAVLFPERYRVEFFDGLNRYYVDDDLDDIAIHNFAGRVLHVGYHTDAEMQLRGRLAAAEGDGDGPGDHRSRSVTAQWSGQIRAIWMASVRPRLVVARARLSAWMHRVGVT
jgi:FkbM family methyltransferase